MRKSIFLIIPVLFSLVSCDFLDNLSFGENSKEIQTEIHDEGTPEWWLKLFTFDNVSIKVTRSSPFAEVFYAKYIDSKYYVQNKDSGEYVLTSESDYDLGLEFRCNYHIFNMQETDETCTVTDWKKYEDSDWLYTEVITVVDGKLYSLEEVSTYNSTSACCILEFSDWGTTTLD